MMQNTASAALVETNRYLIDRLIKQIESNGSLRFELAELRNECRQLEDKNAELQMEVAGYRMASADGAPPPGDEKPKPTPRARK